MLWCMLCHVVIVVNEFHYIDSSFQAYTFITNVKTCSIIIMSKIQPFT